MKTIHRLCLAVGMTLVASAAFGQRHEVESLKGLRTFAVAIGNIDTDATKCGITKQGLDTSVRFILGQSDINVTDDSSPSDATLYVNVTALDTCAVTYTLTVRAIVRIEPTKSFTVAGIWDQGSIMTGSNMSARLKEAVEEHVKKLVNDWNSVNK